MRAKPGVEMREIFPFFSVIGLIGLSSITADQTWSLPAASSREHSDREVWLRCIQDIQHNIINTMSDIIEVITEVGIIIIMIIVIILIIIIIIIIIINITIIMLLIICNIV